MKMYLVVLSKFFLELLFTKGKSLTFCKVSLKLITRHLVIDMVTKWGERHFEHHD